MKQWKTIAITISIVLWIALVIYVVKKMPKSDSVASVDNVKQAQTRIVGLKVILEEQQLITEILTLRYEAAVIQAKFNPVPDPNTP